jgi:hypothetical protein
MGMKSTGLGIAEFAPAVALTALNTVIVNQLTTFTTTNNYWVPREMTLAELSAFVSGGVTVLAVGTATLSGGTATVALASIAAGSVVLLTEANATPNALGYVITAGTGFVIHSASGADTSSVSYVVYS